MRRSRHGQSRSAVCQKLVSRKCICSGTFRAIHKFCKRAFPEFKQRVEMSSRSQAARRLMDGHHSTLHAFFLAAKESGYTEFELQLVASPKGRIELCISPREHSEMSVKFDVRGNTVRAAPREASVVPADERDVRTNYRGTRSGEAPVRVTRGARSSPPRRPAAVTCRHPQ